MHIVAEQRLGLPQTLDENTAKRLKAMVGFRNIAVHDYQTVNIEILQQIIENRLGDFTDTKQILKF